MRRSPRQILVGASSLIFLGLACNTLTGASPTSVGTILPEDQTQAALPTSTGISITPLIPITGENIVSMQCQFCVDSETHAVLVFPDFAYFDVISTSPTSCLTADVVNGRRILICRGTQQTSFNLNICSDSSNCLQFPVSLQECPSPIFTSPFFLTPVNTLNSPNNQNPPQPANTALPPPPPGSTSEPPTNEPPHPTIEPIEDSGEEGGDVVICHIPPGNPDQRKTMTVAWSAWENEHSRHGDSLGRCP